ncbi:MAG: hypothetical protein VKS61_01885 [Candidatus Sericytochromatia bacterium]|nr:hypothetical protein [Candidatus Sericytochromatia bacterium]
MTRHLVLTLGAALALTACTRAGLPTPGPQAPTLRAQARAAAAWTTKLLVNGEPAWDYMSARVNETWTFTVEGPHMSQIRWESDARISGAPNQATIRVTFPAGLRMYEVRCTVRSQQGETSQHRVGVLMPPPPTPLPTPPLPPFPLPPRP